MTAIPRLNAPVVLVHGLFGFGRIGMGRIGIDYFLHVPRALRAAGNRVLVASLSPTGGILRRARQLAAFLDRHLPDEPAHLIAHSMGGIDARWLISRMGFAPRVLSLTTLGTPHRGNSFADWCQSRLSRLAAPVFRFMGWPVEGLYDLTTAAMARFNAEVPDDPRVRYFSVAGTWPFRWNNPSWYFTWPVIHAAEGPNDGLVTEASARWGEGLGVWPGDHMNLANWPEPWVPRRRNDRLPEYAALLGRLRDAT
jgi:triacylglycerol lipase